jgi:hypothetical protein
MSRNIARELNAKNKIKMTNNRKTGRMNEAIKHTFLYLLFSSFHQLEGLSRRCLDIVQGSIGLWEFSRPSKESSNPNPPHPYRHIGC